MGRLKYVCPACGSEDDTPTLCAECGLDLEQICAGCGNPPEECVCESRESEDELKEQQP